MAFRLRHVQSVTLKRFDPCWQLHPDAQLHYELWRGLSDGGQQQLYVSEQVPLDFDLCWQPLSAGKCSVPAELLHRPFTDLLHLTVRAVQPSETLINAAAGAAAGAGSSFAAKQLEPHTGSASLQDIQDEQQQQQHLDAASQQLLYVRYVGDGFRVLLPWQLRQLEQQQDLQQQEGGQQLSQQDSKAQAFPALPALTPRAEEKLVTVCFDAATGTFKVGLAAAAAAAGLLQCQPQQQGREPSLHNSKQQDQPAPQQPAPAHVHQQTAHPDAQRVSEDRVRLTYSNGSWRVEVVAAMQTDTMDASEQQQQQHQTPQQQPLPPQQQQQQEFTAITASQGPASPVVPSSQLLPLRAPAHQPHISWSPTVAAAAPAASPSHAAVVRARQARHTRNSSGCSDAALQLEQQLLEVFTTGSMSAGHGGSATPAPAAAGTLGGSVTPMDFFTAHQEDVSAAGVLADGVVDAAGSSDRLLSIGGNSPALPRTPDQPHRQQQQQQAEALGGSSIHTRNSCQQQQYDPAAVTTQDSSYAVCSTSAVEHDSSADAIQQADSSIGNANSSLAGQGQLLLHFTFRVHDLSPCDPAELKTLPPGLQNPQELHPNKLLLQLAGGLYILPPQPQTPNPAEGPQLSPMASGEDWVGPEGFDSMRLGLASRQLSGQMAAVAQQQQLYRWMLSNSTGILDSLHHSYDEDDEHPGGHSRGSSAGGSSSALSLLGALFSRRSPQITAATAATGVSGEASPAAMGLASVAPAAAAAHGPVSRLLPSSSSAASLTTGVEGDGVVPGDSGASSPQHVGVSIGGVSALTQGSFSGSSRHRRTGSSTATSTALGVGAVLGGGAAAGAVGHRRAQSVSNGGVSWAPPYPKAPLSPASMASLAASGSAAAAAANAAAAVDVPAAPAAAAAPTSLSVTGTAAAATATGEDAAVPAAMTHSSRLAGSIGGSSVSAAAATAAQPTPADRPAAPPSSSSGLGLLQRGFLAGFSFWGSVDDGVGLSAAGAPSERAAVERQYEVDEFVAATKRLISLHQRLHQVQERRDRIKHKVEGLLQQQCSARQQQQRHHMAQQRQQSAATLAAVRQQQLSEARGVLAAQRQQLLARCEGVQEAAGVLSAASQRLCEACGVLEGGEGLGQWKHLHAQLVARRNKLVAQLGTAFQVGPASKSPFAAAPLALQLDASWWAVDPDTAAEAASDAGDTQQQQQQHQQPATAIAAVAHSQQQQQQQEQYMPQLRVQAAQPRPQQAQPKQQQQQQPVSPTVPGPQSPAVDRLLIGGLELPSTLSKRGLQGSMGWGGDLDEEARVAAALGYVAHIVSLLSTYLDVPLRYPLLPRSSRSLIIDPAPVHSHSLETHVHRRFWGLGQAAAAAAGAGAAGASSSSSRSAASGSGGGHNSSSSPRVAPDGSASPARAAAAAAAPAAGVEAGVDGDPVAAAAAAAGAAGDAAADAAALQLPLYYVTGDRTRFAYAVFLLNKDIEQLLHVHGMSSQGPSQVLANLYKLITAAVSGLPQQQGPRQQPAVPGPQQQQQQQQQGKDTCSNGNSSNEGRGSRALSRPAASGAAAEAAAASAGAGAAWLQRLPLPPGHKPQPLLQQQPPPPPQQQQQPPGSQACRQQQGQQQHQQLPHQPQQQQQRGFWRWPWQVEEGHEGQVVGGFPKPQQQQQEQPVIATWDWNDMLSDLPQQQQQQQPPPFRPTAASNGSPVFDLHSWQQQQHEAQLQSANQAAMAAEAAAAAAEKAASVAAQILSQEVGGCRRQQQQQPTCADDADSIPSSRSLASLLSSKWAGDG